MSKKESNLIENGTTRYSKELKHKVKGFNSGIGFDAPLQLAAVPTTGTFKLTDCEKNAQGIGFNITVYYGNSTRLYYRTLERTYDGSNTPPYDREESGTLSITSSGGVSITTSIVRSVKVFTVDTFTSEGLPSSGYSTMNIPLGTDVGKFEIKIGLEVDLPSGGPQGVSIVGSSDARDSSATNGNAGVIQFVDNETIYITFDSDNSRAVLHYKTNGAKFSNPTSRHFNDELKLPLWGRYLDITHQS